MKWCLKTSTTTRLLPKSGELNHGGRALWSDRAHTLHTNTPLCVQSGFLFTCLRVCITRLIYFNWLCCGSWMLRSAVMEVKPAGCPGLPWPQLRWPAQSCAVWGLSGRRCCIIASRYCEECEEFLSTPGRHVSLVHFLVFICDNCPWCWQPHNLAAMDAYLCDAAAVAMDVCLCDGGTVATNMCMCDAAAQS